MAHLRRFGQGPPLQPEGDLIRSKPIPPDRRPVLFSTFLEFIFISAAFVALARLLFSWHQRRRRQSFAFLPMQPAMNPSEVVAIDCTHGSLPTLTHHKDDSNPLGVQPADTSTGITLNALKTSFLRHSDVYTVCQYPYVTTNHFDVDSFIPIWCFLNRQEALKHEAVLRHAARIGDFREGCLSPDLVATYGKIDGITCIREAYTALKLVCWLNTLEIKLFSAPYEDKDHAAKMEYFLPRFYAVLNDPEAYWADWQAEFTAVVSGFDSLQGAECSIERLPRIGLVVISAPEPLHYYSLFSHTHGYDCVLMMYDDNRYELECKYTQFVAVHSRPVWPRIDLAPLTALLNQLEQWPAGGPSYTWVSNRYNDTGPLLRLDADGAKLTKAQRYAHPTGRPIYSSTLPPPKMAAIVQSFFEFGLQGIAPRCGGFSWDEMQALNSRIQWPAWTARVLEQAARGELEGGEALFHAFKSRAANGRQGAVAGRPAAPMAPGPFMPRLSEPSHIMSDTHVRAIAASLPLRYKQKDWKLAYGSHRDGVCLHTLQRKCAHLSPTVLVVKESREHVFGAYAPEAWHKSPRFYGTGETSVFVLQPSLRWYPWRPHPGQSPNDFFLYSDHECIAVGGAGHWAIRLDQDLLEGSSEGCDTFDSPCLASGPNFNIAAVEVWHLPG